MKRAIVTLLALVPLDKYVLTPREWKFTLVFRTAPQPGM